MGGERLQKAFLPILRGWAGRARGVARSEALLASVTSCSRIYVAAFAWGQLWDPPLCWSCPTAGLMELFTLRTTGPRLDPSPLALPEHHTAVGSLRLLPQAPIYHDSPFAPHPELPPAGAKPLEVSSRQKGFSPLSLAKAPATTAPSAWRWREHRAASAGKGLIFAVQDPLPVLV